MDYKQIAVGLVVQIREIQFQRNTINELERQLNMEREVLKRMESRLSVDAKQVGDNLA